MNADHVPIAASVTSETAAISQAAGDPIQASGWYDLDETRYHGDPCLTPSLSSHIAMLVIQKSLLHAWRAHPRSPEFDERTVSSAADRGSAAHALLFGGKAIARIEAEDYRSGAARQARDEARAAGRIPILARDMGALAAMATPARARMTALHGGTYLCEQSAVWRALSGQDSERQGSGGQGSGGQGSGGQGSGGQGSGSQGSGDQGRRGEHTDGWRRARLDTISTDRRLIVDYKTTTGAVDALSCERRITDFGLQIQAAAYVDAVENLHPELAGRVSFVFQWQEQQAPYALSPPIEMSEAFMELGRQQWRAACELWDAALQHNAFPGFSQRAHMACPPPWELTRWEERAGAFPDFGGHSGGELR